MVAHGAGASLDLRRIGRTAQLATAALAYRAPSPYVVGITGAPGGGKSTLTDQLISVVLARGSFDGIDPFDQVGVLCIDPSSPFTGGAILGDRIRMQGHATNEHVFIRSMATRGIWRPLARGARRRAVLARPTFASRSSRPWCRSDGGGDRLRGRYDGHRDEPGWGDAMQANKAGLLEVADIFVINKADRRGSARPPRPRADARPGWTPRGVR